MSAAINLDSNGRSESVQNNPQSHGSPPAASKTMSLGQPQALASQQAPMSPQSTIDPQAQVPPNHQGQPQTNVGPQQLNETQRAKLIQLAPNSNRTGPTPQGHAAATLPTPSELPISQFIELEAEARGCASLDELRFSIVNATRRIAPYVQAFLVEPKLTEGWVITHASSIEKLDRQTPLLRSLSEWLNHKENTILIQRGEPRHLNLQSEATQWNISDAEFENTYGFWLPLKGRGGQVLAGFLALRDEPWRPQNTALLLPLSNAYAHAWEALSPNDKTPLVRLGRVFTRSRLFIGTSLMAALLAFLPVPMSALAPSEIVAREPMLVTATIDGTVAELPIPPGSWVEKGTPIVRFIDVKLRNDVEVAMRSQAVAQAKYFKAMQTAMATQKDMQELATAKAEYDVATSELAYASELLERSVIKAERSGILIYSTKSEWIGKPVGTGERLMEIGDPATPEIHIELPVSDAVAIKPGGAVSLFLDSDPLQAIPAKITRTAYRPTQTAEQQLAFSLYAAFDDDQIRRIGLRGVARVDGDIVPLWFYLFRRPITAVRQRLGL